MKKTKDKVVSDKMVSLGNVQCSCCLNIFEVFGQLPQYVNCPRCGSGIDLEWKTQPAGPSAA